MTNDSLRAPMLQHSDVDSSKTSDSLKTPQSEYQRLDTPATPSSVHSGRESLQDIAVEAVMMEKGDLGPGVLPERGSVRESIRMIHAYSRREFPDECMISSTVFLKKKELTLVLDRDSLTWNQGLKVKGSIDTDDIVGAEQVMGESMHFRVHWFNKGRGKGVKALKRKPKSITFQVPSQPAVRSWIQGINELVRWQARIPRETTRRRIKVVVNPHSGKRKAPVIWNRDIKPYLEMAGFDCSVEETKYSGHAIDMGKQYNPQDGFEALVFISGDGTICEYMNGLMTRSEDEWRSVVATTPLSLISAGTQNAFGTGVGIPTTHAAVYSIIKRKMRPLDVITVVADHDPLVVQYSCCGLGWGVAGDIASESERYRWLGTKRYAFLKVKLGALFRKKHSGTLKYVPVDPQPELKRYDDIKNVGAEDQHVAEQACIYDPCTPKNMHQRSWSGIAGAVRDPASGRRYSPNHWKIENGKYVAVGMLNTVPDGVYTHPSDGYMDLLIGRKGNIFQELKLGILYLFGKELKSSLMSYIKVHAVVLEQDQPENCMNIDGEVLKGPGPWRMEVVPSLLKVLSEK